jgi:hypothetical protein
MVTLCRMGKVVFPLLLGVLALPRPAQAAGQLPIQQALAQAVNLLKSSVGPGLPQAARSAQLALDALGGPFKITAIPPPPGEVSPNNVQQVKKAKTFLLQALNQLTALVGTSGPTGTQIALAVNYVAAALAQVNNFLSNPTAQTQTQTRTQTRRRSGDDD